MNYIGQRIYYELSTGNSIIRTGDKCGLCVETTVEDDFNSYTELKERNLESVGMIQLEYGQHNDDFLNCNSYRVNLETLELEFSFPEKDSNGEIIYNTPYIESTKTMIDELKNQIKVYEDSLLEMSILASEQEKRNIENEKAILELTTLLGGNN